MSPSHLALLGVLGSELQLERLLILRLGEVGSSGAESRSGETSRLRGGPSLSPAYPRGPKFAYQWSSSFSCGRSQGWPGARWPETAGWARAEPPPAETQAALQSALQSLPQTGPCWRAGRVTTPAQPVATLSATNPTGCATAPSPCSLVHRVKGLLQGRGPHLHFLASTSRLLALRSVPGCPATTALTAAAAATRGWGWSWGWAGRSGRLPTALQAQPRDAPI